MTDPSPFWARVRLPFTKSGFLESGLICLGLILMTLLLLPVRFETNDDLQIINILTGHGGYPAHSHTLYLSQTLGLLLHHLYRLNPTFPWYGLTLYVGTFVGMTLVLSVVLRRARHDVRALAALPALLVFFKYGLSFMSYTLTALLLELGAFLCLLEWVVAPRAVVRSPRLYAVFLAGVFVFSFLLRWRLATYFAVFAAPILLFINRRNIKCVIIVVALCCLAALMERLLFYMGSRTPEHRAYMEYNLARTQFHDTYKGLHHGEITDRALKKVGWSLDDYKFYFRAWIIYDAKLFNRERLEVFLRENNPLRKQPLWEVIWGNWRRSFQESKGHTLIVAFLLLAMFIAEIERIRAWTAGFTLRAFFAVGIVGLGIAFLMYYRWPPRIYVPLYAYAVGMTFLLLYPQETARPQNGEVRRVRGSPWYRALLAIAAVSFWLLSGMQCYLTERLLVRQLRASETQKNYIHWCLEGVERIVPPSTVLVLMHPGLTGGLGAEKVHPLKEFRDFTRLRLFPLGTEVNSPRYFSILRKMGLRDGREFLQWTVNRREVLFVHLAADVEEHEGLKSLWESYYNRHIVTSEGVRARFVLAHDCRSARGYGLALYRMITSQVR